MRVCTSQQMARIDRATIDAGTPGLGLMERAGQAMAGSILDFLEEVETHDGEPSVLVLCGRGNNGGDGLVVARVLAEEGLAVAVMMISGTDRLSPEARTNFDRLPGTVAVVDPQPAERPALLAELLDQADVVVDAVFGTGIEPPLRGDAAELFRLVNDAGLPCVALDIPSGVSGDDGRVDPVAIAAELTITVAMPKLGLLLPPGRDFTGEIEVIDIGFPEEFMRREALPVQWLSRDEALELLPPRRSDSHKYRCGSALLLGGSRSYAGAAHLMALGALRSGAGMIRLGVPAGLETGLQAALPEVITRALAATGAGTIAPVPDAVLAALLERQQAVAVGPGLDRHPETDAWVTGLVRSLEIPAVVDADALTAFAATGAEPQAGPGGAVLTPHLGELARLTGRDAPAIEADRLQLLPEWAARWNAVLVLKGSPTWVAAPDGRLWLVDSGDDALARGGSGDLLTGLIAGLLAQGSAPTDAALLGTYVHGLAGRLAATGRSTRSVRVTEIAAAIGPVFEAMEEEASSQAHLRERIWPTGPRSGAGEGNPQG